MSWLETMLIVLGTMSAAASIAAVALAVWVVFVYDPPVRQYPRHRDAEGSYRMRGAKYVNPLG